MPSRCCIHCISKSERPSSGHRTGNGQSSSWFPRRVVLKNVLTIRQLLSSPVLVRSCLKSCMLGFCIMQTKNLQMSKMDLDKKEEPEIKLPTFAGSQRKLGNSRETSTSVSSTRPKPLEEMRIPDYLTCLLRNLYAGQEATVRTQYGTTDWLKIEKGVWQGCLLLPCLRYLYAEHIMRNARLDE